MKKKVYTILALLLVVTSLTIGCGREYTYGRVERDSAQTGGSLSFVYDETTHTATFGGEGEVIAFYPEEPSINRAKGNRIGFKIYAPCDVKDFSKAKLSFQGTEYNGGSFMHSVYEQNMNYFVLTPLVSEDNKNFDVKVTWTQEAKEMIYHIVIADGTKFASES